MPPKGRTVADAIALIEDLSSALNDHIEKQGGINTKLQNDIVDLQKQRIEDVGDMKLILQTVSTINDKLKEQRNAFQVWGPALLSSLIGSAAVIVAIIALGGK